MRKGLKNEYSSTIIRQEINHTLCSLKNQGNDQSILSKAPMNINLDNYVHNRRSQEKVDDNTNDYQSYEDIMRKIDNKL